MDVIIPPEVIDTLDLIEGKKEERPGQKPINHYFKTTTYPVFRRRLFYLLRAAIKAGRDANIPFSDPDLAKKNLKLFQQRDRDYVPYSFRHTFFIQWIKYMLLNPDKISLGEISRMGGHRSEETTTKHYSQYLATMNKIVEDHALLGLKWRKEQSDAVTNAIKTRLAALPRNALKETFETEAVSGVYSRMSPTPEALAKIAATKRHITVPMGKEILERWKQGETQESIAKAVGLRTSRPVFNFIHGKGGYPDPKLPARPKIPITAQTRAKLRIAKLRMFNADQQIVIRKRIANGDSFKEIAAEMGAKSGTISRIYHRTGAYRTR